MSRVHFKCGKLDENFHAWGLGKSKDRTIRGPKLTHVRLTVHPPSRGHRFIFYWPSGAWWWLEIYIDRRGGVGDERKG